MSKKSKDKTSENIDLKPITKRLDALIRIVLETHFDKKDKFNLTSSVKALKSSGLDRQEIAEIFGKKGSDIDPLLYAKESKQSGKKNKNNKGKEDQDE